MTKILSFILLIGITVLNFESVTATLGIEEEAVPEPTTTTTTTTTTTPPPPPPPPPAAACPPVDTCSDINIKADIKNARIETTQGCTGDGPCYIEIVSGLESVCKAQATKEVKTLGFDE